MVTVKVDPARLTADAEEVSAIADRFDTIFTTLSNSLSGHAGKAGDDDLAEVWVQGNGSDDDPGYDKAAESYLTSAASVVSSVYGVSMGLEGCAAAWDAAQKPGAGQPAVSTLSPTGTPQEVTYAAPASALGDGWPGFLGEVQELLEKCASLIGIRIPTGDEDSIDGMRQAWSTASVSLYGIAGELRSSMTNAGTMELPNQIGSMNGVRTSLAGYAESLAKAAGTSEGNAGYVKGFLDLVKDTREQLNSMAKQALIEIAVDIGVGVGLSIITFGIGAAATAAKLAWTIKKWAERIYDLIMAAKRTIQGLRLLARMAVKGIIEGAKAALSAAVGAAWANHTYGDQPWYQAMNADTGGEQNVTTTAIAAFAGGFVTGGIGGIRNTPAPNLPPVRTVARSVGSGAGEGAVEGLVTSSTQMGLDGNFSLEGLVSATALGTGMGGILNPVMGAAGTAGQNRLDTAMNNRSPMLPSNNPPAPGGTAAPGTVANPGGSGTSLPDNSPTPGSASGSGGAGQNGGTAPEIGDNSPTPGGGDATPAVDAGPSVEIPDGGPVDAGSIDLDVSPGDGSPVDVSPADSSPADVPPADAGLADAPPADASPADVNPADVNPADVNPADANPADVNPADANPADANPADASPADANPADASPADANPADAPPADAGPADASPADAPPAESSPADASPADSSPADAPPSDSSSVDSSPADASPADAPPSDSSPADASPADGSPADGSPADSSPADSSAPGDASPSDASPGEGTPADGPPAEADSDRPAAGGVPGGRTGDSPHHDSTTPGQSDADADGTGTSEADADGSDADGADPDADADGSDPDGAETDPDATDADGEIPEEAAAAAAAAVGAGAVGFLPKGMGPSLFGGGGPTPPRGPGGPPSRGPGGPGGPDGPTRPGNEYHPAPWDPEMGDPALSDADFGDGWQRGQSPTDAAPIDPAYGDPRAPGESGHLDDAYAHPGDGLENPNDGVRPEIREMVTDPDAPYGRDDNGDPMSRTEWESRYTGANGRPVYPGNAGGEPGTFVHFDNVDDFISHYGPEIDRLGGPRGDYFALPGTSWEERGLPPSNLSETRTIFDLNSLPPGTRIEVSVISPAFGQPGGGLQIRFLGPDGNPINQSTLVNAGHIDPTSVVPKTPAPTSPVASAPVASPAAPSVSAATPTPVASVANPSASIDGGSPPPPALGADSSAPPTSPTAVGDSTTPPTNADGNPTGGDTNPPPPALGDGSTPPPADADGSTPPVGDGSTPPPADADGSTPPRSDADGSTPPEDLDWASSSPDERTKALDELLSDPSRITDGVLARMPADARAELLGRFDAANGRADDQSGVDRLLAEMDDPTSSVGEVLQKKLDDSTRRNSDWILVDPEAPSDTGLTNSGRVVDPNNLPPELRDLLDIRDADGNPVVVLDGDVIRLTQAREHFDTKKMRADPDEAASQLGQQSEGYRKLTIARYLENIGAYVPGARRVDPPFHTEMRDQLKNVRVQQLVDAGMPRSTAEVLVDGEYGGLALLHSPDRVGGGNIFGFSGMGDGPMNSAIGGGWGKRRPSILNQIRERAELIDPKYWSDIRIDVLLWR